MALNQGKWTGESILSEANGTLSRDEVTIVASSGAIVAGTVLGKITASGKFKPYASGNADGSQVAAAIAYKAVPNSGSDQRTVVVRRMAEVARNDLTGWDATAETGLNAQMIVSRV